MKDPAVLFYTGDFLNGCTGLTFEERGQYITLLCLQHQTGHLSDKTIRLSVGSVSVDVMQKFKQDETGLYFNERMELEINKRSQYIDSRKVNGSKGGRPKDKNKPYAKPYAKPNDKAKTNHSEDININEDEDIIIIENKIDFEFFWNEYKKKVGSKKNCQKKWDNLNLDTQQKILDSLPEYLKQFSDIQFQPYPETYLNQERWTNEIIIKSNGNGKQSNGATWDEISNVIKDTFGIGK